MGRLVILLLIIVTIIVLWKAFGPGSGARYGNKGLNTGEWKKNLGGKKKQQEISAKGPDDDPDFLWNIEKERFKQRREAERKAEQEAEEQRLRRKMEEKYGKKPNDSNNPHDPGTPGSPENPDNPER